MIQEFPYILLKSQETSFGYGQKLSKGRILAWLSNLVVPSTTILETQEEIENLSTNKKQDSLVFYGDLTSPEFHEFSRSSELKLAGDN